MTSTKIVKQDDLANLIEMTFEYATNPDNLDIPVDTPLVMHIVNIDTGVPLTEAGVVSITSSTGGVLTVLYSPGIGDTATPGRYRAELRLDVDGKPLTVPTVSYLNLLVLDKLQ